MLAHDAAPNRHRLFGQLGQSIYEAGQGMPHILAGFAMPTVLAKPTQPAAPITPGAAPVAAPGATSTTMNEQQKKIFIIVGAVAGFLVLFGIVYGVLSSAVFSAKSVATAISSGNYDKANTIADPHVNTNQRALLTSKASSGENTRITNARISQTSNNADGTVSAQLTYTLEGKEVNGNFTIKDNKVSVEFSE